MNIKKGTFGEDVAESLLKRMGFVIIDRNFHTRQGEIDIVAQRGIYTHFIEVKTTYGEYNPAENFHKTKLSRFLKSVRFYCYIHKIQEEVIEIDLALVDIRNRRFKFVRRANLYFH